MLPLAPDPSVLTVEALLGQTPLVSRVDERIYTGWPDYQLYPMITVDTVDEVEEAADYWSARVQVNCWGQGLSTADEQEASLIARTVQAVSRDIRGAWPSGHICNSAPLTMIPAPDAGWWRYAVDLQIEYYV